MPTRSASRQASAAGPPKAYPASSKFLLGTPPRAEPLNSFEAHLSQALFDPA